MVAEVHKKILDLRKKNGQDGFESGGYFRFFGRRTKINGRKRKKPK